MIKMHVLSPSPTVMVPSHRDSLAEPQAAGALQPMARAPAWVPESNAARRTEPEPVRNTVTVQTVTNARVSVTVAA